MVYTSSRFFRSYSQNSMKSILLSYTVLSSSSLLLYSIGSDDNCLENKRCNEEKEHSSEETSQLSQLAQYKQNQGNSFVLNYHKEEPFWIPKIVSNAFTTQKVALCDPIPYNYGSIWRSPPPASKSSSTRNRGEISVSTKDSRETEEQEEEEGGKEGKKSAGAHGSLPHRNSVSRSRSNFISERSHENKLNAKLNLPEGNIRIETTYINTNLYNSYKNSHFSNPSEAKNTDLNNSLDEDKKGKNIFEQFAFYLPSLLRGKSMDKKEVQKEKTLEGSSFIPLPITAIDEDLRIIHQSSSNEEKIEQRKYIKPSYDELVLASKLKLIRSENMLPLALASSDIPLYQQNYYDNHGPLNNYNLRLRVAYQHQSNAVTDNNDIKRNSPLSDRNHSESVNQNNDTMYHEDEKTQILTTDPSPYTPTRPSSSINIHVNSNYATNSRNISVQDLIGQEAKINSKEDEADNTDGSPMNKTRFSLYSYRGNEFIEDRYDLVDVLIPKNVGGNHTTGMIGESKNEKNPPTNEKNDKKNVGKTKIEPKDIVHVPATIISVFDGHGGPQVAEYAKKFLSTYCALEFQSINLSEPKDMSFEENMTRNNKEYSDFRHYQLTSAITRAFERLDREYISLIRSAFKLEFGKVANVGSCAISAIVVDDYIYVANAGDCRCVLGSNVISGKDNVKANGSKYIATPLSIDHNAKLEREQELLKKIHPNESDIVRCKNPNACYVKGRLQPTRALGDAYLKYPEFNGPFPKESGDRSAGRHIPAPYTPPYITATPEISTTRLSISESNTGCEGEIPHRNDKFIILASDGLWDLLSNEEAVDFVGKILDEDRGKERECGKMLVEYALRKRGEELGLTLADIYAIPAGPRRRRTHDDITVVIYYL